MGAGGNWYGWKCRCAWFALTRLFLQWELVSKCDLCDTSLDAKGGAGPADSHIPPTAQPDGGRCPPQAWQTSTRATGKLHLDPGCLRPRASGCQLLRRSVHLQFAACSLPPPIFHAVCGRDARDPGGDLNQSGSYSLTRNRQDQSLSVDQLVCICETGCNATAGFGQKMFTASEELVAQDNCAAAPQST